MTGGLAGVISRNNRSPSFNFIHCIRCSMHSLVYILNHLCNFLNWYIFTRKMVFMAFYCICSWFAAYLTMWEAFFLAQFVSSSANGWQRQFQFSVSLYYDKSSHHKEMFLFKQTNCLFKEICPSSDCFINPNSRLIVRMCISLQSMTHKMMKELVATKPI